MRYGYVRVSTEEQNTERQVDLMKKLDTDRIFIDTMSGKNMDRPQLKLMLQLLREGDTVVVESISRIARNTRDLLDLIETFNKNKVKFISNAESIDTNTPTGIFMVTIFGAVAQLEREYILQRQRMGIEIAKKNGKFKGRPRKRLSKLETIYNDWRAKRITARRAAELLGVGISTFYRRIKDYEGSK